MLAHGGIAILAVVFALATATVSLADALAREVISVLQQHLSDPETGEGFGEFTVFGTDVQYLFVLYAVLAVALIAAVLFGLWRIARSASRTCPECLSDVPREAAICRYCTTELPAEDT